MHSTAARSGRRPDSALTPFPCSSEVLRSSSPLVAAIVAASPRTPAR